MVGAVQDNRAGVAASESMQLGMLARGRGDRLTALAHFRAAANADPGSIRPRIELARELAELCRPDEAKAALHSVLRDAPNQPQAQALLAHLGWPGRGR